MPDRFGRPLRKGDRIIHGSSNKGLLLGELVHDEETHKAYHMRVDGKERLYYPLKPWRGGNDRDMLNLTLYVQDQLDKGTLDLIH